MSTAQQETNVLCILAGPLQRKQRRLAGLSRVVDVDKAFTRFDRWSLLEMAIYRQRTFPDVTETGGNAALTTPAAAN
jgi:hypothetical protein